MGKRAGGVGGIPGMDNNVYFMPEVAKIVIDKISEYFPVDNHNKILDACAGKKALGGAIQNWYKERGYSVGIDYQDIVYKDANNEIVDDILEYNPDFKYDLIICNPPWVPVELTESIYHHLMGLLSDKGTLFYIINNSFIYQGWERAIKLRYIKSYFLPRYVFNYGENKKKKLLKTNGNYDTVLLDVSILVCPVDYKENNFIYIPKDIYNERMF